MELGCKAGTKHTQAQVCEIKSPLRPAPRWHLTPEATCSLPPSDTHTTHLTAQRHSRCVLWASHACSEAQPQILTQGPVQVILLRLLQSLGCREWGWSTWSNFPCCSSRSSPPHGKVTETSGVWMEQEKGSRSLMEAPRQNGPSSTHAALRAFSVRPMLALWLCT